MKGEIHFMAIAMRLKYRDVIQDGSLKNIYVNGKKMGYKFDIMLSYYRGHFLSVIDEISLATDGELVKTSDMSFVLKDKEFGVSQLHDLVSEFWPISEKATIKVFKEGGLAEGEHELDFKLIFHSPYMPISDTDYMPWDSSEKKTLPVSQYQ